MQPSLSPLWLGDGFNVKKKGFFMANAEQSKLYLSPKQYKQALIQSKTRPDHIRLGQWLVNRYGEKGVAYPHIFYLDDPTEAWSNVKVVEQPMEGE